MNRELLSKVTKFNVGGMIFCQAHRHLLRAIPKKEGTHIFGYSSMTQSEVAFGNKALYEYLVEYDKEHNIGLVFDHDDVSGDVFAMVMNALTEPEPLHYQYPALHPLKLPVGRESFEATFWQCVAVNLVRERNHWAALEWSGVIGCPGTLGVTIKYPEGGQLFLGIEEDGYTHS